MSRWGRGWRFALVLVVVGVVQGPKLMKQLSPPAPSTLAAPVGVTKTLCSDFR